MRIYVGNLAAQTTENELREAFAAYGQISQVVILRDKQSSLPRSFGFVEMNQDEEGALAIAELNGTLLRKRPLKVSKAGPLSVSKGAQHSRTELN